MSKRTKLYILTGFLGAGKTTFLKKAIDDLSENRVGVIMNEFGKISIDGMLVKTDDIEVSEVNRGSIFCSCLKINFIQSMVDMAKNDLDYLFVESSGLADPSNIGDILYGLEGTEGDVYDYCGAICIVDASNIEEQLKELEMVERQIKHCHVAAISKSDLVDEAKLIEIDRRIKEINPNMFVTTSQNGVLNHDIWNKNLREHDWADSEDTTNTEASKPKTLHLTFNGSVEKEKIENFINEISPLSYRIKGFFKLEEGWKQIDVVNKKIDYKNSEEKEMSELVIISKVGPAIIRPIANGWKSIVGEDMKLR